MASGVFTISVFPSGLKGLASTENPIKSREKREVDWQQKHFLRDDIVSGKPSEGGEERRKSSALKQGWDVEPQWHYLVFVSAFEMEEVEGAIEIE